MRFQWHLAMWSRWRARKRARTHAKRAGCPTMRGDRLRPERAEHKRGELPGRAPLPVPRGSDNCSSVCTAVAPLPAVSPSGTTAGLCNRTGSVSDTQSSTGRSEAGRGEHKSKPDPTSGRGHPGPQPRERLSRRATPPGGDRRRRTETMTGLAIFPEEERAKRSPHGGRPARGRSRNGARARAEPHATTRDTAR